jgi:hypothetical protein
MLARAQEAQEALEEILYYQALSWEDEEAVVGLVASGSDSDVAAHVEVAGDEDGGMGAREEVAGGGGGESLHAAEATAGSPCFSPPAARSAPAPPLADETPRHQTPEGEGGEAEVAVGAAGSDLATAPGAEEVFEMVLGISAEEVVGREDEVKQQLAREVCASLSLRSLEQQAAAMARRILSSPSATPLPKQGGGQQQHAATPALPVAAQESPDCCGEQAEDYGDLLCRSGALQVRDLILEPGSVIVEVSWTPAKAMRDRTQPCGTSSSGPSDHAGAAQPGLLPATKLDSSGGAEQVGHNETRELSLADTHASKPSHLWAQATLPSSKHIVADLEAQIYTPNSRLKQGVYSSRITGLSQPLPIAKLWRPARSTPSARDTAAGSPAPDAASAAAERGQAALQTERLIEYEAPYLVQRCTLMTVKSLEAQIDVLHAAMHEAEVRATQLARDEQAQVQRRNEMALSADAVAQDLAALKLELVRAARDHAALSSEHRVLQTLHAQMASSIADSHAAIQARVVALLELVSLPTPGDSISNSNLNPSPTTTMAAAAPAPTSGVRSVWDGRLRLQPCPAATNHETRALANVERSGESENFSSCADAEQAARVTMKFLGQLDARLQGLVGAEDEAGRLRQRVDELEERVRGLEVCEEEAASQRRRVIEVETRAGHDLRALQAEKEAEAGRLNALLEHSRREAEQAAEMDRLREIDRVQEEAARREIAAQLEQERAESEQGRAEREKELQEARALLEDLQKQVVQKSGLIQSLNDVVLSEKEKVSVKSPPNVSRVGSMR